MTRPEWRRHGIAGAARLGALLCGLSYSLPAAADIIGGGLWQQAGQGRFVILDPGAGFAVGADTFDDDNLYAFPEVQGIALGADLAVEIGTGPIPAGTPVDSHYVFFDSVDGHHFGFVQFDAPILGVATSQASMAATDRFGHPDITYLSPSLRGLETGDEVWIDADDPTRLLVLWAGSSPGDYIRVFTLASDAAPLM